MHLVPDEAPVEVVKETPPVSNPLGFSVAAIDKFLAQYQGTDLDTLSLEQVRTYVNSHFNAVLKCDHRMQVYSTMVNPYLFEEKLTFASKWADGKDATGAALVDEPTVFVSYPWSSPFAKLVNDIKAFESANPGQFYWVDIFDSHANISQALAEPWWSETFGDAVTRYDSGAVFGYYPWNGPKGVELEENVETFSHPV